MPSLKTLLKQFSDKPPEVQVILQGYVGKEADPGKIRGERRHREYVAAEKTPCECKPLPTSQKLLPRLSGARADYFN